MRISFLQIGGALLRLGHIELLGLGENASVLGLGGEEVDLETGAERIEC